MKEITQFANKESINIATGMLAIFTLLLIKNPYFGILHDAQLYLVEALNYLRPENFEKDVYFQYGSQGRYSLFGMIYAKFISLFGVELSVKYLTFFSNLIWFLGAAFILSSISSGLLFWLAMFLVVVMPPHYGSSMVFSYAEFFLTPRAYAEAFGLIALGFIVIEKKLLAFFFLILALSFHPIMALPVVIFFIVYGDFYKIFFHKKIVVPVFFILIFLSYYFFDRVFSVMDDQWYRLAIHRAPYLDVVLWKNTDWILVVFDFCVLLISYISATGKVRKLLLSVVIVGFSGLLIGLVGGSLLKNALVIQIQSWRCLWLVHFFCYFSSAYFSITYWRHSDWSKVVILIIACSWLMIGHYGGLLVVLALAVWMWRVAINDYSRLPKLIWFGVYLICIESSAWFILNIPATITIIQHYYLDQLQGYMAYSLGLVLLSLFYVINYINRSYNLPWFIFLITSVSCFVLTLAFWDKRLSMHLPLRNETSYDFSDFKRIIPDNGLVYWISGRSAPTWILLGRSHYVSATQTAGIVFNRNTAMEALRRTENISHFGTIDKGAMDWREFMAGDELETLAEKQLSIQDLKKACQDPILDFIILSKKVSELSELALSKGTEKDNYYLYGCKDMR